MNTIIHFRSSMELVAFPVIYLFFSIQYFLFIFYLLGAKFIVRMQPLGFFKRHSFSSSTILETFSCYNILLANTLTFYLIIFFFENEGPWNSHHTNCSLELSKRVKVFFAMFYWTTSFPGPFLLSSKLDWQPKETVLWVSDLKW